MISHQIAVELDLIHQYVQSRSWSMFSLIQPLFWQPLAMLAGRDIELGGGGFNV